MAAASSSSNPPRILGVGSAPSPGSDPAPTETTSLLVPTTSSRRFRAKRAGAASSNTDRRAKDPSLFYANSNDYDAAAAASLLPDDEESRSHDASLRHLQQPPPQQRPILVRFAFLLTSIFLILSFSALILIGLSTTYPIFAYALPSHHGSSFLPLLLAAYVLALNSLTFLDFVVAPTKATNRFERACLSIILLGAIVMSSLVFAIGDLRWKEGALTGSMLALVVLSTLLAFASLSSVERYGYGSAFDEDMISNSDEVDLGPDPTSMKRILYSALSSVFAFLSITLPIFLIYLTLTISFFFLTLNVVLRGYDASLQPDGQLWTVDPWSYRSSLPRSRSLEGTSDPILAGEGAVLGGNTVSSMGFSGEKTGRPYNVHLNCQAAVPLSPPFPLSLSNASSIISSPRLLPVRTILVESSQGISSKQSAEWVLQMRRSGKLDAADREVRVCYWDRPGYGFSDNSATSSAPHVVAALYDALSLSGELARLSVSSSISIKRGSESTAVDDDALESNQSGLILIPTSYGTLISTLYAATFPSTVHSILYLAPLSPSLYYSLSSPRSSPPSSSPSSSSSFLANLKLRTNFPLSTAFVEFGWDRLLHASFRRTSSREARYEADEEAAVRGEVLRSWMQERKERWAGAGSAGGREWERRKGAYPARRSTVVLSDLKHWQQKGGKARLEEGHFGAEERREAEATFVRDVLGKGLRKWERQWSGDCEGDGPEDREMCEGALRELIEL